MWVSHAYRYVWLFDAPCGIAFTYIKNNKGSNIDNWGTLQVMLPASIKTLSNEMKKALLVR